MKKSIAILLVILANNLSFSQIQKGSWILGGSINANNNNFKSNVTNFSSTNSNSSTLNFIPEINYAISNKFIIGGGIGYSLTTTNYENIFAPQFSMTSSFVTSKSQGVSGFVQAKYYINISKNIWWNINLKSGLGKFDINSRSIPLPVIISQPTSLPTQTSQISNFEPTYFYSNLSSQVLFIPFQHFGFQLDIGGLNYLNYEYGKVLNSDFSSNNISFNINPSNWSLGIFYIFGKTN